MFSIFANEVLKIDSRFMENTRFLKKPRKIWTQKIPTFECKNPTFECRKKSDFF